MRRALVFPVETTLVGGTPVETTFETMAAPPPYDLAGSVFGWVFQGEELLLTCDRAGIWGLPGGTRRPGETLHEAFERSLWEMTGAQLGSVRLLGALRTERRGVWTPGVPLPLSYRVCFTAEAHELVNFSPALAIGERMLIDPSLARRVVKHWSPLLDEMLLYVQAVRTASRDTSRQLA